jgi:hypothetical protein
MTSDTENKVAIADLFTRYCCALDNGEVETVVDCAGLLCRFLDAGKNEALGTLS